MGLAASLLLLYYMLHYMLDVTTPAHLSDWAVYASFTAALLHQALLHT
jgi:hypothetical protein